METLQATAVSKGEVAKSLYGHYATPPAAPLSCGNGQSTTQDPLLSQCFGNRSAVLFELEQYEASQTLCMGFPNFLIFFIPHPQVLKHVRNRKSHIVNSDNSGNTNPNSVMMSSGHVRS